MNPKEPKKLTEEEIAYIAEIFFSSKGWDMYPEAIIPIFSGRPDFIGKKQQLCLVTECKTSLTYPVLEQLTRWHHKYEDAKHSEYIDVRKYGLPNLLIAVTGSTSGIYSDLKAEILRQYRIGHYEVRYRGEDYWKRTPNKTFDSDGNGSVDGHLWAVKERVAPKIQPGSRRTSHKITELLRSDMKIGIAGTTGIKDAYMTPFKRTLKKAEDILQQFGEMHIAEVVEVMNLKKGGHHYSNDAGARERIGKFLLEFGIADRPDENRPFYRLKGLNRKTAASRYNAARKDVYGADLHF